MCWAEVGVDFREREKTRGGRRVGVERGGLEGYAGWGARSSGREEEREEGEDQVLVREVVYLEMML